MNGAIFLDRDGVLIEDRPNYVKDWSEVEFIPGVFSALRKLGAAAAPIVLVTNQSAVGRGIISAEFVEELHERIVAEIRSQGGRIDAIYYCPHHPDAKCICRKPEPGMLEMAARDLAIGLHSSFFVGDAVTDLQAARSVGATGVLVRTGRGAVQEGLLEKAGFAQAVVVPDLDAAVDLILGRIADQQTEDMR